jgi:hypothetical protein
MGTAREIERLVRGYASRDGAGVNLTRVIGSPALDHVDPFMLLDELRSDDPDDYTAGFPEHPHRGIETITYMIDGGFRHRDSRGGGGLLGPGCVQWMTAGRGIVHSEMPEVAGRSLWGYQLWLSLPTKDKMIEPRYQHMDPKDIPVVETSGLRVIVISGNFHGTDGHALTRFPVTYLDARVSAGAAFECPVDPGESCMLYVHSGEGTLGAARKPVRRGDLAILGKGDAVALAAGPSGCGFLLLAARPNNEPVARGGPFVMNTPEEIRQAFRDYRDGTLF